jgi:hypothetical protein
LDADDWQDELDSTGFVGTPGMLLAQVSTRPELSRGVDSRCSCADYASSAALEGYKQRPVDDLESLCYSLLELWLSRLPWSLTSSASAREGWSFDALGRMVEKRNAIWARLCDDGTVPDFLIDWHEHLMSLARGAESPCYETLLSFLDASQPARNNRKRKACDDADAGGGDGDGATTGHLLLTAEE